MVFIIAITGCIYAFQEEIQNYTDDFRFVQTENKPVLEPSQIKEIAEKELPNKVLHSIKYFKDNHSIEVSFYHYEPTYYYKMYLNPYSGKVLHTQNMDEVFFNFILKGHMYLWLPQKIGSVVVLIATLIFFLMVITGLVLWFPKKWNVFKKRIWFQWKSTTKWKRKNWDLHGIIGFYSCFFALIFIITGLVWVLPNFAEIFHKSLGGKKSMTYQEPISKKADSEIQNPLDKLYQTYIVKDIFSSVEIHPAETDSSSILVVTNPDNSTYWKSNYVFHNQYNLQELKVNHIWGKFNEATNADKILRLNYDIHVGSALGLTGKVIAFFASLLIATLPITGFMIWYGRRKKDCH
jgi:uncharacterized iron-regulated membrane protein